MRHTARPYACLLVALIAAACGSSKKSPSSNGGLTYTDGSGESVALPNQLFSVQTSFDTVTNTNVTTYVLLASDIDLCAWWYTNQSKPDPYNASDTKLGYFQYIPAGATVAAVSFTNYDGTTVNAPVAGPYTVSSASPSSAGQYVTTTTSGIFNGSDIEITPVQCANANNSYVALADGGTVTLSGGSATAIAGTFNATTMDSSATGGTLVGTFSASPCPGTSKTLTDNPMACKY